MTTTTTGFQLNVNVQTVAGATVTTVGAAPTATSDDFMRGSNGIDYVNAGAGNDRVWAGNGADYVDGGAGNDVLYGENGNDTLMGGLGHDRLFGGADMDVLMGEDGNDYLDGGADQDSLFGGAGSDDLRGGDGADFLDGGTGHDALRGGAGADRMFGGEGNDWIEGGAGNDFMSGGAGSDTFYYWLDNSRKSIDLANSWGSDTIADFTVGQDRIDMSRLFARFSDGYMADLLESIQRAVDKGSTDVELLREFDSIGGDRFRFQTSLRDGVLTLRIDNQGRPGSADQITLRIEGVQQGADVSKMFVRESMKVVHLSEGSDSFDGATASQFMLGGKGLELFAFGGDDRVTGSAVNDWIDGGAGADRIDAGAGNDTLFGGAGADEVSGGAGADRAYGGSGDDQLFGDAGNDQLWGDAGADALNGGDGNDHLFGGAGNDTLTGGAGADTFVFQAQISAATVDWVNGKAWANVSMNNGQDVITDFSRGQGDRIQIADWMPREALNKADLRQQFVSDWFDKHVVIKDYDGDGDLDSLVFGRPNHSGEASDAFLIVQNHQLLVQDFFFT